MSYLKANSETTTMITINKIRMNTGVFRIPPNLFNVTCSALMGLLPPHSYILTSEYIMHGSRLSAKPTPNANGLAAIAMYIANTPVAIQVLTCRASTSPCVGARSIIFTMLWVTASELCNATSTSSPETLPAI